MGRFIVTVPTGTLPPPGMSGWALSRTGRLWHQADQSNRGSPITHVRLLCCGTVAPVDAEHPMMDYRWRPPADQRCQHPICQQEVDP